MLPLSTHARFEMGRRGITDEDVKEVYQHPQQKIGVAGGRQIWQNKIERDGKVYILRIVMEVGPEEMIVTVYKSSKIEKYWKMEEV